MKISFVPRSARNIVISFVCVVAPLFAGFGGCGRWETGVAGYLGKNRRSGKERR